MRSEVSLELVDQVATLARLNLTDSERSYYQQQLQQILAYVNSLQDLSLQLSQIEHESSASSSHEREDEFQPVDFNSEIVLSNAPKKVGTAFQVPKIIE